MRGLLVTIGALLGLMLGCEADVPDATYVCTSTAECPPAQRCADGLCQRNPPDTSCVPMSCNELRAECGEIDDGCGTTLDCGGCDALEECGVGGIANICDCVPGTCEGVECGLTDDGCGAMIDCGSCDAPRTCGGGGDANVCGCEPVDCTGLCGDLPDPCGGGVASCGDCPTGETCGGGGPNVCGTGPCTPMTCVDQMLNCGPAADGCGVILDCGSCTMPDTCGGGPPGMQITNVCGCTPNTCGDLGVECGNVMERCGTTLDCGGCSSGDVCNPMTRMCCTPRSCGDPGIDCGALAEGCGGMPLSCGTCMPGYACTMNSCVCGPDPNEGNDNPGAATPLGPAGMRYNVRDANLHAAIDQDWWILSPPTGPIIASRTYTVTLSRIPAGAAYRVSIIADCTTAAMDTLACDSGTFFTGIFSGGCSEVGRTGERPTASLGVRCSLRNLYVLVEALTWGGVCSPFELDIS